MLYPSILGLDSMLNRRQLDSSRHAGRNLANEARHTDDKSAITGVVGGSRVEEEKMQGKLESRRNETRSRNNSNPAQFMRR